MKRLIVVGPRRVQFEDVPEPACPDDGVVVRARLTAVSTGTEIRVYRAQPVDEAGRFLHERVPFELPAENGYSMVGHVVEVGDAVENPAVGDRVFATAPHQQLAAVSEAAVTKISDEVPDEQAVFLNILEVGHIAVRRGDPKPASNVAVVGQGVVGLSALAFARTFGFRTAAVDLSEERLQIAESMGADVVASPVDASAMDALREFFDGEGADLVVEAASDWRAIETSMKIARNEGVIVVAARHIDRPEFNPVGQPYLGKNLTLLTSYGHEAEGRRWDRRRSTAYTLDRLSRRLLNVQPMITHRFGWRELPDVYRRLDEGDRSIVGAVIDW